MGSYIIGDSERCDDYNLCYTYFNDTCGLCTVNIVQPLPGIHWAPSEGLPRPRLHYLDWDGVMIREIGVESLRPHPTFWTRTTSGYNIGPHERFVVSLDPGMYCLECPRPQVEGYQSPYFKYQPVPRYYWIIITGKPDPKGRGVWFKAVAEEGQWESQPPYQKIVKVAREEIARLKSIGVPVNPFLARIHEGYGKIYKLIFCSLFPWCNNEGFEGVWSLGLSILRSTQLPSISRKIQRELVAMTRRVSEQELMDCSSVDGYTWPTPETVMRLRADRFVSLLRETFGIDPLAPW